MELVKFPKGGEYANFFKELRKEVNAYFRNNNIPKTANLSMKIKTVFMILLYTVPYFLMLSGVVTSAWGVIGMYVIMAFGMSGIGLSIMHDAIHGSYSKKKWVNYLLGNLINAAGGSSLNWKIQHNVLHHSFTNIYGLDQDIYAGEFLRFSPHQKRRKMHNYQHLYAWFFYSLMTIYWVIGKDFKDLIRYKKMGVLKTTSKSFKEAMTRIIIAKVVYMFFLLVLPILVLPVSAWVVVLGFLVMHFLSGIILSLIFQPAHVVEETVFPQPDENQMMEDVMAVHQLKTTVNFAMNSKIFTWLIGGLNYQVEHHLFPTICHIHYPKISKIVRDVAKKYQLPYYSQPTFAAAVADHLRMLKKLGRMPETIPAG